MQSLEAFAAARVKPGCGVCALSDEIRVAIFNNQQRDQRVRVPSRVVAEWASTESGTRITTDMIQKHFYRNH